MISKEEKQTIGRKKSIDGEEIDKQNPMVEHLSFELHLNIQIMFSDNVSHEGILFSTTYGTNIMATGR